MVLIKEFVSRKEEEKEKVGETGMRREMKERRRGGQRRKKGLGRLDSKQREEWSSEDNANRNTHHRLLDVNGGSWLLGESKRGVCLCACQIRGRVGKGEERRRGDLNALKCPFVFENGPPAKRSKFDENT
jgi:hypothetical protein